MMQPAPNDNMSMYFMIRLTGNIFSFPSKRSKSLCFVLNALNPLGSHEWALEADNTPRRSIETLMVDPEL